MASRVKSDGYPVQIAVYDVLTVIGRPLVVCERRLEISTRTRLKVCLRAGRM